MSRLRRDISDLYQSVRGSTDDRWRLRGVTSGGTPAVTHFGSSFGLEKEIDSVRWEAGPRCTGVQGKAATWTWASNTGRTYITAPDPMARPI